MDQLFDFNFEKISISSEKEEQNRKKSLKLFLDSGLPNKKEEDWKFSDLNSIINKNFKKIYNNQNFKLETKIKLISDFDHNYIKLVNGILNSSDFKFEDKKKIKIKKSNYFENTDYQSNSNLLNLNKALSVGGFNLEIEKNYRCKKPVVIYNYFTSNLDNQIINNSNSITLNQNSELTLIEYTSSDMSKFLKNTFEKVNIDKDAILKNFMVQKNKSNGFFYKHIFGSQGYNSSYQNFILTSGLKFNKLEIEMNLEKENSNCFILSGLCLGNDEHQEIKTKINHLAPNCKSYQKIKNVLENNGIGVYQGKIFVKDIAQKTNAYQLSKALLLNDAAEFNAKPELEIYADDVKCSHGSSSGSIDEEAIHYMMTRGIELSKAKKLLINGFLSEIFENVPENQIKIFLEKIIDKQINDI
tara:strand:- start:528 stop:1769 length:1242 start_codon:yes stop_codon:yes gene_type:complete